MAEYEHAWRHYLATAGAHQSLTEFHLAASALLISAISLGTGLGVIFTAPVLFAIVMASLVWGLFVQSMLIKNRSDFAMGLCVINSIRSRLSEEASGALKADVGAFPDPPRLLKSLSVWMMREYLVVGITALTSLLCSMVAFMNADFELGYPWVLLSSTGVCLTVVLAMLALFCRGISGVFVEHYGRMERYRDALASGDTVKEATAKLPERDKNVLLRYVHVLVSTEAAGSVAYSLAALLMSSAVILPILACTLTSILVLQVWIWSGIRNRPTDWVKIKTLYDAMK